MGTLKVRKRKKKSNRFTFEEVDYKLLYEASAEKYMTDRKYADTLGICLRTFQAHKQEFFKYFEEQDKINPVMAKKRKLAAATHGSKSMRKLTPTVRRRILDLFRHEIKLVDILKMLNIKRTTYYTWVARYPLFRSQVENSKRSAVVDVKKSLVKRCTGLRVKETVITTIMDDNDKVVNVRKTERVKEIPPSVRAQEFYLCNRDGWTKATSVDINSTNRGEILEAIDKTTQIEEKDTDVIEEWDKEL